MKKYNPFEYEWVILIAKRSVFYWVLRYYLEIIETILTTNYSLRNKGLSLILESFPFDDSMQTRLLIHRLSMDHTEIEMTKYTG